ncbi:MAG: L-seryl-tRNA(Sec) selenium transferase [Candidatus Cloacimonetes bacterium]|nr:L-seryl-tRNA(Sec) selenium transferase [Candidatus Cloacimonadota bacterium]
MNKEKKKTDYRKIPSVNRIILSDILSDYRTKIRAPILKRIVSSKLEQIREEIVKGNLVPEETTIVKEIKEHINKLLRSSLSPVINATGVILHTNLGRAPFDDKILTEIIPVLNGYSNLEFNLLTAQRGSRNVHLNELLKVLLNCENSVVVNNNAAALMLTLRTLAADKEVIISRGELVEIGGSFRIPEIIEASGAKLIEVGTTNRTRLSDYEKAITENTALYLKVHKSNYYMYGFTEEVSLKELSKSAKKNHLNLIYDLGTGLIDRQLYKGMENEPDALNGLQDGADVITFSCDKLLGGAQAGIIAGRNKFIQPISKHPMMRALRVDKLTISLLNKVLISFLHEKSFIEEYNPVFRYINREMEEIETLAKALTSKLKSRYLDVTILDSKAQCGGGTLPYHFIDSKIVKITPKGCPASVKKSFAENLYHKLLTSDVPVLGILREGTLMFDVLALENKDIELIGKSVKQLIPFW